MIKVPLTEAFWKVEYDGGGQVLFNPDGSGDLVFQPQQAKTSGQTFSTLILLKDSLINSARNYAVKFEVTTEKQLRLSTPNEWEVFWFVGNYKIEIPKGKTANYFVLKPTTGAEFGRMFEEVGQHFLKTDLASNQLIGERATFIIVKEQKKFQVYKNGLQILDYQGGAMPESLYDQAGAVGLYAEDAIVRVHSFAYQNL